MGLSVTDSEPSRLSFKHVIPSTITAILGLYVLINAISAVLVRFDHNEHMYVTSAILLLKGHSLYEDFAFLQMPYISYFYAFIFKVFFVENYLLAAKIVCIISFMVSALLVYLIALNSNINRLVCFIFALLFLNNYTLLRSASEVSNYILPVTISLLGFYVYVKSVMNRRYEGLGFFLSGIFIGLAAGFKLTFITIMVPFYLSASLMIYRTSSKAGAFKNFFKFNILFLMGFSVALAPIVNFLSDFDLFYFNNFGYHQLNTDWRYLNDYGGPMTLTEKLDYAAKTLNRFDNLILLTLLSYFSYLIFSKSNNKRREFRYWFLMGFNSLLLFIVAMATSVAPTPSFLQYYSMPIAFLFLFVIFLAVLVPRKHMGTISKVMMVLLLASCIHNFKRVDKNVNSLFSEDSIASILIHEDSMRIKQIAKNRFPDEDIKVATLSPLLALKSGMDIYPEFSTGPFLYRVTDLIRHGNHQKYRAVGQSEMISFLEDKQPEVIVTGYERDLDNLFLEYAIKNSYLEYDLNYKSGKAFIRN